MYTRLQMYYLYSFFCNYYFVYIYIIIYTYILIDYIFMFNSKFSFKKIKTKKIHWVEIWNIDTKISKLEKNKNTSWYLYYKYKLSIITSWHILEERFLIFIVIILICFF